MITPVQRSQRRIVLAVAMLGGGCYVFSTVALAPVLVQLARDFGITIGTAGLATAVYAIPAIIIPLIAGPFSDRYGRERFLISGALVLALGSFVAAGAPTFALVMVGRAVAGFGAGLIGANVVAVVADHFPVHERGRVLASFAVSNAVVTLGAVPLAGIVAAATTWRVPIASIGALGVLLAVVVATKLPRTQRPRNASSVAALYALALRNRGALLYLAVGFLAGMATGGPWITFAVAFFQTTFGLPQATASALSVTYGVGFVLGGQLGGRLGDRIGHARLLPAAIALGAIAILAMNDLPIPLVIAAALNLVLALTAGARLVMQQSLVSEQVPEARATLLSINSSLNAAAVAIGIGLGGTLIDLGGFPLLGAAFAAILLFSAALMFTLDRGTTAVMPEAA